MLQISKLPAACTDQCLHNNHSGQSCGAKLDFGCLTQPSKTLHQHEQQCMACHAKSFWLLLQQSGTNQINKQKRQTSNLPKYQLHLIKPKTSSTFATMLVQIFMHGTINLCLSFNHSPSRFQKRANKRKTAEQPAPGIQKCLDTQSHTDSLIELASFDNQQMSIFFFNWHCMPASKNFKHIGTTILAAKGLVTSRSFWPKLC